MARAHGGRDPRGRPRPHPLPRRQHLLDRLPRVRRAVRERDLRLPRLRRARGWRSATAAAVPEALEEKFRERTAYQRETGTPIWVGEFGPVYTGVPELDEARLEVLDAQLSLYERYGAGWSLWTYKDVGLQGLVYARADSAVHAALRRVHRAQVAAGHRLLGLDRPRAARVWSSRSTRSSPTEFPDWEPYPWNVRSSTDDLAAPHPLRPGDAAVLRGAVPGARRRGARCAGGLVQPRVVRAPRAPVRPRRRAHGGVTQPLKTVSARNLTALGSCALIRIVSHPRTPTATFWPPWSGMIA